MPTPIEIEGLFASIIRMLEMAEDSYNMADYADTLDILVISFDLHSQLIDKISKL